jgi:cyclopropane-fatty-acyl-phospholipid synthase
MNTQVLPKDRSLSRFMAKSQTVDQISKSILLKKFNDLKYGSLTLEDRTTNPSTSLFYGEKSGKFHAKVVIHKSCFFSRTLFGGSIGNAESYVDVDWDTEDLTQLVQLFVSNRDILQGIDQGIFSLLLGPIQKYFHGLRGNSIVGSKENIRSHYDIGNDFFKLFLDETMMYSSAIFDKKETSLLEASNKKIKTICDNLKLTSEDHLIEIGTGWGSLAIYAAKNYGCKVTTTTISKEQFNYAQEQIKKNGLEHRIELLFEDYRLLKGTYSKLVSVEMIEAVGLEHLETYFEKCSSLLKENGLMVLQAITIRDSNYESAKNSVDFIQRHIFPGSGIPSVASMMSAIAKKTTLVLVDQKDYAEDYAQTLLNWSQNLKRNEEKITQLGYPDYLHRLWQFYFSYCEGGFRERAIGLSQMTLNKPLYRNRSLV